MAVPYEHTGIPYISGVSDGKQRGVSSAIPLVIHPSNPSWASHVVPHRQDGAYRHLQFSQPSPSSSPWTVR